MKQNNTKISLDDNDIEFFMFVLAVFQFIFTAAIDIVIAYMELDGHIEDKYCTCPRQEPAVICPECKKERKVFKKFVLSGHVMALSIALLSGNYDWLDLASYATLFRFWAASLVGAAKRASRHPLFGEAHLRLLDRIETSRLTATNNLESDHFLPRLSAWHLTEFSWTEMSCLLCLAPTIIQYIVPITVITDIIFFDSRLGLYLARTDWLEKFNKPHAPATVIREDPTIESQIRTLESISKLLAEDTCSAELKTSLHKIKSEITEDVKRRASEMYCATEPAQAVPNPAQ